jgi:glycosyltransferase involved in cell wall biosynthesis
MKNLKVIAIDLTPILPGGENGGAKIFVLELLPRLAELYPSTDFLLLTNVASHDELSTLDRSNMRRQMVIGLPRVSTLRERARFAASKIFRHLPGRIRNAANRWVYKINTAIKRGGTTRILRDLNVDLLFCPFTAPTFFEPGIPTVCTILDLQYKTHPDFFSPEDVANRDGTFIDACRKSSALTAISEYSRGSAIKHSKFDPRRVRTIHLRLAQRMSSIEKYDPSLFARLGITRNEYVIYPANFWKHKNHEMLLTAFGMACQSGLGKSIKLVCTGASGARQIWLESATNSLGLQDRIVFPGFLPTSELASLLANSKAMIFPSLYEGFGLPIVEAMAAGVPVACSNSTALPEVASDAAILFDPRVPEEISTAIKQITTDEVLREKVIAAGRKRADEFMDSNRMAKEYWNLFEFAIESPLLEAMLSGAHPDGWMGPSLHFYVNPAKCRQSISIEVSFPNWLPYKTVKMRASSSAKSLSVFELTRGNTEIWTFQIDEEGGSYEIDFDQSFIPAKTSGGNDERELSLMLISCAIHLENGEKVMLYPSKRTDE